MYKNLLNWLTCALIFPACSSSTPHISVVCEENQVGNCIVKWETTPMIHGNVKVYESLNPEAIPEATPVAMANIADQRLTIITKNPTQRYYYTLVFNEKYKIKVASRNINIPGIQNFRDMGGYRSSTTNKEVRWGMLYRSAQIDTLENSSYKELKNIGIKTIIDLRSQPELTQKSPLQKGFNVIHIPIQTGDMTHILQNIQQGAIRNDTVHQIVKQMNRELVLKHQKEYRQIFDVLLDKNNYPIVINCSSGKGRTGIAAALIFASLGVSHEVILEDYRLSNEFFNIPAASRFAYSLPPRAQEAITTLFSAREDFLMAAKEEIDRYYGDIGTYLAKAIKLEKEEIEELQQILLTGSLQ